MVAQEDGNDHLLTRGKNTMRHLRTLRSKKGQSLIEYAVVVALVSAAMVAMSTYVFRSVQATEKVVEEEFANN